MRKLILVLNVCLFCWYSGYSQEVCSLRLGDSSVHVVIHSVKGKDIHFLNLHDNENTSVEAAAEVMQRKGGRLTEIRHSGERLIRFSQGERTYEFDPNRMFSPAGRRATLNRYSKADAGAEQILRNFADSVLRLFGAGRVPCIVALHNNTEDDYSAKSYLPGAIYTADARKVFLEPGADTDDFVMVTRRKFYRFYKRRGINVVLQSKKPTDDGSLSVYSEWNKIPYINIEAQEGHLEEQKRMIEATYHLLTGR